jgi:hypothetical protein
VQVPDIGHFISFFEPCRIHVISSDICKHLHKLYEDEEEYRDLLSDNKLLAQWKKAAQGIYSVILHQCGDHRQGDTAALVQWQEWLLRA